MMAEFQNTKGLETSKDLVMPLPLTEEGIRNLPSESLTEEFVDQTMKALYPGLNLPENVSITAIPIIPGITLFSYIRFFNANPKLGGVDIYVNGRKIATNLLYRHFTEYFKTFPGYYRVAVFPTGKKKNPICVNYMNLIGYRIYTAAITSTGEGGGCLEMVNDNRRFLKKNQAYVRFVQLSENAPRLDVYLDNNMILSDLNYREVSRYLAVEPGTHSLILRDYLSGLSVLEDPVVTLEGGKAYTIYVVGDMKDRVGLQVIIPLEGATYLTF